MKEAVQLQKIIFPYGDKLEAEWTLFWKGARGITENGELLRIPKNNSLDFATYLNGFPLNKWKNYAGISNLTLTLDVEGKFTIKLTGYSLNPNYRERHVYVTEQFDSSGRGISHIEYPIDFIKEDFLAFELYAYEDCVLYGGCFESEVAEKDIHPVELVIATTTCFKEAYIKSNVELIKKTLLESDDPIKEHLYLNVVDNGRTLTEEDIYGYHVRLFPNNNAGGSGGYSRGMIEALHMSPEPTHILLMDDDVLVLPESIRRTYTLLRLLKDEYKEAFISGAMLHIDALWKMHEDIGSVTESGEFCHIKPISDLRKLDEILTVNKEYQETRRTYAAWWYCCIPLSTVKKQGLSYPFFIRIDDAEYSMRCRPKLLTMSGICIWHMGFENKFKESMDYYQRFRNSLVAKDICDEMHDVDIFGRFKNEVLRNELLYNYDGVEALLRALEDYMKGPKFFMKDQGFEILKEMGQYNQKLVPLSEMNDSYVIFYALESREELRTLQDRALYYLTLNGQRFLTPRNKPGIEYTSYDWAHNPSRTAFHETIMAVNVPDRTACIRKRDKERFKKLHQRYKKDLAYYHAHHEAIREAYRKTKAYMTSEKFWRKYLQLDKQN